MSSLTSFFRRTTWSLEEYRDCYSGKRQIKARKKPAEAGFWHPIEIRLSDDDGLHRGLQGRGRGGPGCPALEQGLQIRPLLPSH